MNLRNTSTPNYPRRFSFPTEGFTVIEILISVGLLVLLLGIGLWVSMDAYRSYSFRSERNIFISALQKARLEAMVNINESRHGLRAESDKYVLFQGNSYGDYPALDRIIKPPRNITITGNPALPRDIVFHQLSGDTDTTGSLTISDGVRSAEININSEGGIFW